MRKYRDTVTRSTLTKKSKERNGSDERQLDKQKSKVTSPENFCTKLRNKTSQLVLSFLRLCDTHTNDLGSVGIMTWKPGGHGDKATASSTRICNVYAVNELCQHAINISSSTVASGKYYTQARLRGYSMVLSFTLYYISLESCPSTIFPVAYEHM